MTVLGDISWNIGVASGSISAMALSRGRRVLSQSVIYWSWSGFLGWVLWMVRWLFRVADTRGMIYTGSTHEYFRDN